MNKLRYLITAVAIGLMAGGCTKFQTTPTPEVDILFALEITGNEVLFINKTEGAQSFRWDFGDGNESTSESPVHQYPGKGKYVATLYATLPNGNTYEGSTVINIAKTSPVRIDDNTLSDWEAVTQHVIDPGSAGGIVNEVKLDYDGNYLYLYVDLDSQPQAGDIFDFYLDSDNNPGTGLLTGTFSGGGYDILLEGPLLAGSMDVFYHEGPQSGFTFAQQSIPDYYTLGTVVTAGGRTQFELRIERGKLKGLTGGGLRLGMTVTKSDWSAQLGRAPGEGQPAYLLPMDE
ncbi:PKD domain-containing protein [Parapedobacter sp. ISTM3]|uniref:PKD domain-containing protein n=1 Tax=Parapedobacter luteus TaxID=623280 RepID=A0A1T5CWM5_9SPHI|nr:MULTISPECIES: PKD domain-containing protein [Parapedobacter]MBK1440684.1 PKD domain-containing protein [Parapedobacter sp. ISTM3]SKB63590.1 PKD domain-containing protein [Parapedobacter luteus]